MRLIRLSFAFLLLCILNTQAQNIISIDDAVKSAIEKNIELQIQRSRINKTASLLSEAVRLPNPAFNYSREDLKMNNLRVDEWIASGSIPINFLWERWSNIESKEKYLEAEKFLLDNSIQSVAVQVKNAYLNYHLLTQLAGDLNATLEKINLIAETAKQRVKLGDIPEYELQRILLEVTMFSAETKQIEIDKNNSLSELKLLTGYSDETITTQAIILSPVPFTADELIKTAVNNRKDLKAIDMLIESEEAFLSHNKLKVIPNINFTAGYKKQSDDYSGSIMQLNFEIPLFKRNQMEIDFAESELNLLLKQRNFLAGRIHEEIKNSSVKYLLYKELYENSKFVNLHDLLTTAVYSYEQGEKSLVEFLDGLNAYKDALILSNDVELNYYQSYFELEKVSAINTVNEKNKGE